MEELAMDQHHMVVIWAMHTQTHGSDFTYKGLHVSLTYFPARLW